MSERKPFPWRAALLASVALNLLLVGGAIGAYGAGARLERRAPPQATPAPSDEPPPGPRVVLGALPPDVRAQLREDMARGAGETRALRQSAVEARQDAFDVAAEEPYDAAKMKQAFQRMRDADQAVVGVFHDRVAESFATMTPEQRRAALDGLRRGAIMHHMREHPEGAPRLQEWRERREERRERWRERREQRLRGG